jgi:hypothetical protein
MSSLGHLPAGVAQSNTSRLQSYQRHDNDLGDSDNETNVPSSAVSEDIGGLARYLSAQDNTNDNDFFNYEKGSPFDPFGDAFDAKLWVRKFASLEDLGQDRMSGVSFKNMTVFGYGTDAGEFDILVQQLLVSLTPRLPKDSGEPAIVDAIYTAGSHRRE